MTEALAHLHISLCISAVSFTAIKMLICLG
jgi:hypothetical protein